MIRRIGNAFNIDCLCLLVNGIFKIFRFSSCDEFDANSMGFERDCTMLARPRSSASIIIPLN